MGTDGGTEPHRASPETRPSPGDSSGLPSLAGTRKAINGTFTSRRKEVRCVTRGQLCETNPISVVRQEPARLEATLRLGSIMRNKANFRVRTELGTGRLRQDGAPAGVPCETKPICRCAQKWAQVGQTGEAVHARGNRAKQSQFCPGGPMGQVLYRKEVTTTRRPKGDPFKQSQFLSRGARPGDRSTVTAPALPGRLYKQTQFRQDQSYEQTRFAGTRTSLVIAADRTLSHIFPTSFDFLLASTTGTVYTVHIVL